MPCSPGMNKCRRDCLHRAMVRDYRDARDAREALRESDTPVPAAHAYGAMIGANQLEPDDFDAAFPPVTFRAWLEDSSWHHGPDPDA